MSNVAVSGAIEHRLTRRPNLDGGHPLTGIILMGVVGLAVLFVAYNIYVDVHATGAPLRPICLSSFCSWRC